MATRRRSKPRTKTPWWVDLPSDELLDVRLCDLGLEIPGTALERRVERLHGELAAAGFVFRPYVWLSVDWFTPEGTTGFAVPFYLAHRRLVRLEHDQMFEAEGSKLEHCMKLLRHEAGHALDNAYRLHRRAWWRETFGRYGTPYRSAYRVDPNSRHFVHHLGGWYAQSHPAEDWAESFAVWVAPDSDWRERYAGWPALKKLRRVDAALRELLPAKPLVRSRDRPGSLPSLRLTLREHYRQKQAQLAHPLPLELDHELRRLFDEPQEGRRREPAATFLRRERHALRNRVSALTGQYRYVVDQTLDVMQQRCAALDLRLAQPRNQARLGAAVLATRATMQLTNGHRPHFRR